MTSWLAESLKPNYRRALIGFDFRLPSVPALPPLKISNPTKLEKAARAATLDPELWQRTETEKYDGERNGINLIDKATKELYEGISSPAATLVAFDIPATLFSQLQQTFGFRDLDANRVFSNSRWRQLGFDIADVRTESSALYSFDLTGSEQDTLRKAVPFPLNDWGLVNQESDAISACARFDAVIPGHAPFAPVGVWIAS